MQIVKVKFVNHGESVKLSLVKSEKDGSSSEVEEHCKRTAHIDFRNAMAGLHIHFALNADYILPKQLKSILSFNPSLVEKIYVSGYSIGGDDDSRGFVLTGTKFKSNGKAINLNTPFTRFVETEESQYQFVDDLEQKIKLIEQEVKLYLDGKCAPEPQQQIEFPETKEEDDDDDFKELAAAANSKNNDGDHDDDSEDKVKVVKGTAGDKPAKKKAVKKNIPKKAASKKGTDSKIKTNK